MSDTENKSSLSVEMWAKVEAALLESGVRATPARRSFAEVALTTEGYFDADSLHARTLAQRLPVSRATVYRMLPVFCKVGLLYETDFGDGHHRYRRRDPAAPSTAEIYVIDCGAILDLPAPFLTQYATSLAQNAGTELIGFRLQAFARCPRKAETGACEKCPACVAGKEVSSRTAQPTARLYPS